MNHKTNRDLKNQGNWMISTDMISITMAFWNLMLSLLSWNNFRFTEKFQRQYREFPHNPYSIFPNVTILLYIGMFVYLSVYVFIQG